ncbi:hypothetical protein WA171_000280, partial [Blastocystis sp. BT1]
MIIHIEQAIQNIHHTLSIIGFRELRPWNDFFETIFNGKSISKPITETMKINLLYYCCNYALICLFLFIPFLFFKRFLIFTVTLAFISLLFLFVHPLQPRFLYLRYVYGFFVILILSTLFRLNHL